MIAMPLDPIMIAHHHRHPARVAGGVFHRCLLLTVAGWSALEIAGRAETTVNEPFRIEAIEQVAEPPGWRIEWQSEAGARYRVERSPDLDPENWTAVETIEATGELTSWTDETAAGAPRRFWRVVRLGPTDDNEAPVVESLQAFVRVVDGEPALELRAVATDDTGVVGLEFLEREDGAAELTELGDAAAEGGDEWVLVTGLGVIAEGGTRVMAARARDAAGNTGESPETGFTLGDGLAFAGLGPDGGIVPGKLVEVDAEGNLGAFAIRAGGGGEAGAGGDLIVAFPAGGRVVEVGDVAMIEFGEATADFGDGSPLRFEQALTRGPTGEGSGTGLLPLGGTTVADLEAAFGLDAGAGLDVVLFGKFPLRWVAGRLTDRGIEGAVFEPRIPGLALPDMSGLYEDLVVDFSERGVVRLPFFGEFALPTLDGQAATVRAPRGNPLWLSLRADGTLGLHGRIELQLAGGGWFRADVTMDDPEYRLALAAEGIEAPFLTSLADLLPTDAISQVPAAGALPETLDLAADALDAYRRAYAEFAGSAQAVAPVPENPENGGNGTAPPPGGGIAAIAEAWARSAANGAAGTIAQEPLAKMLSQLARGGRGATDFAATAEHLAAAQRVRTAMEQGNPALAVAEDALAELEAVVVARSREPGAIASLANFSSSYVSLARVLAETQTAGLEPSEELLDALEELIFDYLADLALSYGIDAGEYDASANPVLEEVDRFLAIERASLALKALGAAMEMGLVDPENWNASGAPVDELLTQVSGRAAVALREALAEAEAAGDYRTALDHVVELFDLEAARQLGVVPDTPAARAALEANGMPTPFDFEELMDRLETIRNRDGTIALDGSRTADAAREVVRLNRILDAVPDGLELAVSPARRALERLDTALGTVIAALGDVEDPARVAEWIEAGAQHARLTRRLTNAPEPSAAWEAERMPALVDRLIALSPPAEAWPALERAQRALLDGARALAIDAGAVAGAQADALQELRRQHLFQAARLLECSEGVAGALWTRVQGERLAAGDPGIDAILPGNVSVESVAGMFRFNRQTGAFGGSLSGAVDLPGLLGGVRMTLERCSFSSAGSFDAVAWGAVNNLPLGGMSGNLTVPARRPLRIAYRAGQPLEIAGGARMDLSNGIFFEGYLDFADPIYRFGAAAGGVRLDLANRLSGYLPVVAVDSPFVWQDGRATVDPAFAGLGAAAGEDLRAYLASMSAALDPLAAELGAPLDIGLPGSPPEFQAPQATFEFDGVNAFFAGLAGKVQLDANAFYQNLSGPAFAELERMAEEAEAAAGALDDISFYLQALRRMEEQRRISERIARTLDSLIDDENPQGFDASDIAGDEKVSKFIDQSRNEVLRLAEDDRTTANRKNLQRTIRSAIDHNVMLQAFGEPSAFDETFFGGLIEKTLLESLVPLGLNPDTGEVADESVFESALIAELDAVWADLLELSANLQIFTGEVEAPEQLPAALATLAGRRRALAIGIYQNANAGDWQTRQRALDSLTDTNISMRNADIVLDGDQPQLTGGPGPHSLDSDFAQIAALLEGVLAERERDMARRASDPIYRLYKRLRELAPALEITPQLKAKLQREIETDLDRLLPQVLGLLPTDAIPDSRKLINSALELAQAAYELEIPAVELEIHQVVLPTLTVRLGEIAEAQRAWWVMSDFSERLAAALAARGGSASDALTTALDASLAQSLLAARSIAGKLADDVAGRVNAGWEPFELALPGDLTVRRVFGDFLFDRSIPLFRASLGGEIEFPEVGARFRITEATVDNSGVFAFSADTRGPVPLVEGMDFSAGVTIAGGPGFVPATVAGTGSLTLKPPLVDQQQTFEGAVSYEAPGEGEPAVFALSASAEGALVPLPDFAIFNTAVELRFLAGFGGSGSLAFEGSAGMLLRGGLDPERATVVPEDFSLVSTGAQLEIGWLNDGSGFDATFTGGTLALAPAVFGVRIGSVLCDDLNAPISERDPVPPTVELPTPLRVSARDGALEFGTVDGADFEMIFQNFGFDVPGFDGFAVDVCEATVVFAPGALPVLGGIDARMQIPLPTADPEAGPLLVKVTGADWRLDGLPGEVEIALLNDLSLIDSDYFGLRLLAQSCGDEGAYFKFASDGEDLLFEVRGGAEMTISSSVMTLEDSNDPDLVPDFDGAVRASACATFRLERIGGEWLPDLLIDRATFCGRFTIGDYLSLRGNDGPDSFACITFVGLQNVFAPTEDDPFEIWFSGRVGVFDIAEFGIQNAGLIFTGYDDWPGFKADALVFVTGDKLDTIQEYLPVRLDQAELRFKGLPGNPFDPANLRLIVDGEIELTIPGVEEINDIPIPSFRGGIAGLGFDFEPGPVGIPVPVPDLSELDSLVMELENFGIGELGGVGGSLAIGNLQRAIQEDDFSKLYFAGGVSGKLKGVKVGGTMMVTLESVVGLCIELGGGPAGIPVDGGTLGGILLSGGRGGLSFGNEFANPCDFKGLIGTESDPPPGVPWTRILTLLQDKKEIDDASEPLPPVGSGGSGGGGESGDEGDGEIQGDGGDPGTPPNLDSRCPTGDCPPATVNLLCQRHPSLGETPSDANYGGIYANRVIFKFSSLDRATVTAMLELLAGGPDIVDFLEQFQPQEIAEVFAALAREQIENLLPPTGGLGGELGEKLDEIRTTALGLFEQALIDAIVEALGGGENLLESLYEAAYAGVPCFDVTMVLEGTITHSVVSSFASISGGIVSSSTGSDGVFGSLNLLGIPVGTAEMFISYTDSQGNPNPSFCGSAKLAIGPLELGSTRAKVDCEGCVTGVLAALWEFTADLAVDAAGDTRKLFEWLITRVSDDEIDGTTNLAGLFGENGSLGQEQQLAVMAQMLNLPGLVGSFLDPSPETQAELEAWATATGIATVSALQAAVADLAERTADLLLAINEAVNPKMVYCEELNPKLFGFPLMGGELVGTSVFAGRVLDGDLRYDEFAAQIRFSPSFLVNYYTLGIMSGGLSSMMMPAFDSADVGFSTRVLAPGRDDLIVIQRNPLAFAAERAAEVVENSLLTFNYRIDPYGLKLFDGQARVVVPQLASHPNNPARIPAWTGGSVLDANGPVSRPDLLVALVEEEVLGNPLWRGNDLDAVLPDMELEGLSLVRDFFPHGGLLGASRLELPRPITRAPPFAAFDVLLDADAEPTAKAQALQEIFGEYLLEMDEVGKLALYVPAPNPPVPWELDPTADDFMDALRQIDPAVFFDPLSEPPLAFEEAFITGEIETPLFGMPGLSARIDGFPAEGRMRIFAEVPNQGWIGGLLGGEATLEINVLEPRAHIEAAASVDPLGPASAFKVPGLDELRNLLDCAMGGGTDCPEILPTPDEVIGMIVDSLPRASFESAISLSVPDALADLMALPPGGGNFRMFGFSPMFEPEYEPADFTPYALAKRRGGLGLRGDFTLGAFGVGVDVEDASIAIIGGDQFTSIPRFLANLDAPLAVLPGGLDMTDVQVFLDSAPEEGDDRLRLEGRISPPSLGPLFEVVADSPDGRIGGEARIGGDGVSIAFDPTTVTIPLLGGAQAIAAGCEPGERFTFTTVSGMPWCMSLTLVGGTLGLRDPANPAGDTLVEIDPAGGEIFNARIDGVGLDEYKLVLTLNGGTNVRVFPGMAHETTFQTPVSTTCLVVTHEGRVYLDSGTRELNLGLGLAHVTGRVEFGIEPPLPLPVIAHSTPAPFSAAIGNTVQQTVTVSNTAAGSEPMVVDATVQNATHYSVFPPRLIIPAGESADLTVRFSPRNAGSALNTNLLLASNATAPSVSVPLTGSTITQPGLHLSASSVNFGATPLGLRKSAIITLTNTGTGALSFNSVGVSGTGFSGPSSIGGLGAGSRREIVVEFRPTAPGAASGTLSFNTNDPTQPTVSITLSGNGSDRHWVRQRAGAGRDTLADIAMLANGAGTAVGGTGARLQAAEAGRFWRDDHAADPRSILTIAAVGTNELFAAGAQGLVIRSTDGGASWTTLTAPSISNADITWRGATRQENTGRVVLVGEQGGQGVIAVVSGITVEDFIPLTHPPLHGVAFRTSALGIAVGADRTILRTSDGGKTWIPVTAHHGLVPAGTMLRGIAVRPFGTDHNYIVVGDGGRILRTNDGGTTWNAPSSGTTRDLHAVSRNSSSTYIIVGDGGSILRGGTTGVSWVAETADTSADFRGIKTVNEGVNTVGPDFWAVTADGDVFHRMPTPLNGPVVVFDAEEWGHGDAAPNEVVVRQLRIANEGSTELNGTLNSSNRAYVLEPDGNLTIPPGGEERVYVSFTPQSTGVTGTTVSFNSNDPVLGNFSANFLVNARHADAPKMAYLTLPPRMDLGSVAVGQTGIIEFAIGNIGNDTARIQGIEARHASDAIGASFRFNGPTEFDVGEETSVQFELTANEPGVYHGTIEIVSDAENGLDHVEWKIEVVEAPDIVLIRTDPPGLPMQVDNNNNGSYSTYHITTAFVVVDGPVTAGSGFIQRGTQIPVRAFQSFTAPAQKRFDFRSWTPGGAREFNFEAGASAAVFTAAYADGNLPQAGPGSAPQIDPTPCGGTIPTGVASGPWLRISDAVLELPWLRNAGDASAFAVEGALFLSPQRAVGSLRSSGIQLEIPDEPGNFGDFAGAEVLHITPTGWSFDLDAVAGTFQLGATSPGWRILGQNMRPPTQLDIEVDLGIEPANRRAFVRSATLDELPLLPGVLALGPGAFEFETGLDLSAPGPRMALNGSLRAIARPTNPSLWVVNRPYQFEFGFDGVPPAAIHFASRTSLFNLGAVHVYAGAGAQIGLVPTGSSFRLALQGLELRFFGNNDYLPADASASDNGTFLFESELPEAGTVTGPLRLVPFASNDRTIHVAGNPAAAALAVDFPQVRIRSTGGLWPDNAISTPGRFSFDSNNFTLRLPLNITTAAGFQVQPSPVATADNFFEFRRTLGTTTARIRSQREYVLGAFRLRLDVSGPGIDEATFSGRLGVKNPPPLDAFTRRLSLGFDPGADPEFVLNRYGFGVPFRLRFGTVTAPIGSACLLIPSGGPIENWPTGVCD